MKKNKSIVSFVIAFTMIFTMLFGTTSYAITVKKGVNIPNSKLMAKLPDPNVKVFIYSEPDELVKKADKYFTQITGAKINYTLIPWADLELKTITAVSAGNGPDTVLVHAAAFPRYAIKKLAQPVENYFDLKDPIFDKNGMEAYKWEGKYYGVCTPKDSSAVLIWYNKTMFENNGLETPLSLYKKGKCNFKTFRDAAMELTQDTNGDGKTDQWGYTSWMYELFALANGGKFVNYSNKGNISLDLENPNTVAGLQFMQDGYYKDKYIPLDANVKWITDFAAGKVAMTAERSYVAKWYLTNKVKFKWDVVPFPLGAGNKTGRIPGDTSVMGIAKGAKNPLGAASYIYNTKKYILLYAANYALKDLTESQLSLIESANKRIVLPLYNGIGNWWNMQWTFWGDIFEGKQIAATIAKYKPLFQKEIDITIADDKLPEIKPFKDIPIIDFEDKSAAAFTKEGGFGADSVDITSNADEVVAGKTSLKIGITKGSEWALAARSVPTKVGLPAQHTYKIKFDYKVLGDVPADGYYFIVIRPAENFTDGKVNFGWLTIQGAKTGVKATFEGIIAVDKESVDNCLVIGSYKGAPIAIDNVSITE